MSQDVRADIEAIGRLAAVPTILRTIREMTGLRYTLVARVLPDRWIACAVHDDLGFGLGVGDELDVKTTLCSRVRDTLQPVIIDDAATDPVYSGHPTPKLYGFSSYISVPIFRRNGEYFGTLCGLDPDAHVLKDGKTLATLQLFTDLIALQLEANERLEAQRRELEQQRELSRLREEFIAVLGHDLRNPLYAIQVGTELLLRRTSGTETRGVVQRMQSSARRIGSLVDDLLDLARGRLGGGIALDACDAPDLQHRLRQVVDEVQALHPTRPIEFNCSLSATVRCDPKRVEQVLSNLLGNAVEHGAAETPVQVSVTGGDDSLQLCVSNRGAPIPEDVRAKLFLPFFRVDSDRRGQGLGLGLYIVAEIARSHGGRVDVSSEDGISTFTFTFGPSTPLLR